MRTTPDRPTNTGVPKAHIAFGVLFIAITVVLNAFILRAAWHDKSWDAIRMAFIVGPVLNGALVLSGLAATPLLERYGGQFSLRRHLMLTLGVPIAAAQIDFFIIISMGLHGC